ncbi:glucosamine-6-phosphate deaminase [Pullulanibacillus camelliae]|uniref:glucosamine-6-phosphate deaminase n=1 Tax=Pullulanibacillus camelliae TaxID=1707096 RepID=UPI001667D66E|nr:glucosamine-6-phosphate deaminase [Pullulanibacillus camelliae]
MQTIVTAHYEEMSQLAADQVAAFLIKKTNAVLGLATGGTPLGMYDRLIQMYHQGKVDFSHVTTFNLDEYIGLSKDHPQSYAYYMWHHLFSHVNVHQENVHIPPGVFEKQEQVQRDYEQAIERAGGIDLQILGIGENGHIGFNEPGMDLEVATHVVPLTEKTIQANARFFTSIDEVPRRAVTLGMGKIMQAKHILLLASGKEKARAIAQTVNGHIDPRIPSSFLQLHPHVTMIIDKEAAQELQEVSSV